LPRIDEIEPLVDGAPNAQYFRQSADALFVRCALVEALLPLDASDS
jgi:aspartate carbamoyltransferase catalytic subunit